MTITERDTDFQLEFPYRKHIIDAIKRTFDYSKRTYDPARKVWLIDKSETVGVKAFAEQFQFIWNKPQVTPKVDYSVIPEYPTLEQDPADYVNANLYDYQKRDVATFLKWKRGMNGIDMGLGKTLETITTMLMANAVPALVLCPASLKYNWQDELKKFANINAIILTDAIKNTWPNYHTVAKVPVFITNYESLIKYFVVRMPRGDRFDARNIEFNDKVTMFKMIIMDEAHYIKNESATRTKVSIQLAKFMEYRLLLSGTFIVNKAGDLIAPLRAIGKLNQVFGSRKEFEEKFCGKEVTDEAYAELNYKLRANCLVIRKKKDHLKDLPPKTRQIIHCTLSNQKEYDEADGKLESWIKNTFTEDVTEENTSLSVRQQARVQFNELRRIAARGKVKDTVEYIQNVLDTDQKIVVFCWHKQTARDVQEHFPTFNIIDGDVKPELRHHYIRLLQEDDNTRGLISTIGSGGTGHNMTAASVVLFIEMGWNPKDQDQAEDRLFRNGQKKAVLCPYMIAKGTVDERNYEIIEDKRVIVNKAYGQKDDVKVDVLCDLINYYKNK